MDAQKNGQVELIPEIYAALSISFKENANISYIISKLEEKGLCEIQIQRPKCSSVICLDIAIINYVQSWELDGIITKMFLKILNQLQVIKNIAKQFCGEIYIDVAIYHYGTIPAIVICKDNIKKINYLNANISIDIQKTD